MLYKVKTALRIKTAAFDDDEIKPIIEACLLDLRLGGVNKVNEDDPLIQRAVVLYAKAHFGFSEDSEKYGQAYEHLKAALALSGDYNAIP